jgi:anti-sigma B factor antagonist
MVECQWMSRWIDPAWLLDKEGRPMFNVNLSTYELNGRPVVTLRGQLDVTDVPCVAAHLTTAVAVYGPWIIVDLEGLDFIDCSGLGVLVGVLRRVRASGGDLPLAAPQHMVGKVLTVTGLMDVFSVHPTVEQATHGQGLGRAQVLADNLVTIRGLQTADMATTTAIA